MWNCRHFPEKTSIVCLKMSTIYDEIKIKKKNKYTQLISNSEYIISSLRGEAERERVNKEACDFDDYVKARFILFT